MQQLVYYPLTELKSQVNSLLLLLPLFLNFLLPLQSQFSCLYDLGQLLPGLRLSSFDPVDIEKFFNLGSLGVVLEFCESEYFFLELPAKLDQNGPILLDGIRKITVLFPLVFPFDLADGKLEHFAFRLNGVAVVKEEPHVVSELLFGSYLRQAYSAKPLRLPLGLKSVM